MISSWYNLNNSYREISVRKLLKALAFLMLAPYFRPAFPIIVVILGLSAKFQATAYPQGSRPLFRPYINFGYSITIIGSLALCED